MKIDFTKLLGVGTLDSVGLDFFDDTFGAKLRAKVGDLERDPANKLQFSRLLGFDTVIEELAAGVDLQNETIGDKVGAKIGPPEPVSSPAKAINFQNDTLGSKLGAKVGDLESGGASDARLKRDITQLATRDDGLPIYSFRYLWDDEVHVGVMAQDLLCNEAWAPAVVTKEGGALFVGYAWLGLRMTTLDEWQAKGIAALMR